MLGPLRHGHLRSLNLACVVVDRAAYHLLNKGFPLIFSAHVFFVRGRGIDNLSGALLKKYNVELP